MIPIEQILKAEIKAREFGFYTKIENGGELVEFRKELTFSTALLTLTFENSDGDILLGVPGLLELTPAQFSKVIDEQQQLLELAKMLQSSEPKTTKTMLDFNDECSKVSSKPL